MWYNNRNAVPVRPRAARRRTFGKGAVSVWRIWYNHTMSQENLTTENILQRLPAPLLDWYRANARDLPWRRTRDPYRIWVSEIMLQQTRVAAVLGYYARFLTAFPTVEALAAAPEERLMKLWEGLGYYSRARNLQKTARIVAEQGGRFPDTYEELLKLVHDRDYFVLTTNVDHQFQLAGFDKKRLFYTQGDYGLLQCCEPCHRQTYDNRALILRMVEEQKNMRIPTALIPRCPKCGKPMAVNLRSDDRFAEDEGWRKAAGRYADFLRRHDGMHILLWEIGVGYNTPGIIKYPFWQMTAQNPNAVYACLNSGQAVCPGAIQRQSICIDGDAGILLQALLAPEESYE